MKYARGRQRQPPVAQVDDLLKEFEVGNHPFKSEIDQVIRGETALGRLLMQDAGMRKLILSGEKEENFGNFKTIFDFVKKHDLHAVDLTREDILFLITTDAGNLLRRPLIHTKFAQHIEAEVNPSTEDGRRIKEIVMPYIRGAAWSRYIGKDAILQQIEREYPNDEVFVDVFQIAEEVKTQLKRDADRYSIGGTRRSIGSAARSVQARQAADTAYTISRATSGEVLDEMMQVGKRYRQNRTLASADWKRRETEEELRDVFMTDPDHAFNHIDDVYAIAAYVEERYMLRSGEENLSVLREVTLAVVEDNEIHRLLTANTELVGGIKRYNAPESMVRAEKRLRDWERYAGEYEGYYSSGERLFDVIEAVGSPPDAVLVDQELRGRMLGTDVVRELHRRWPNTVICMLYSSNPEMHKPEFERLRGEGIDVRIWHKDGFRLSMMVEQINAELQKRG